MRRAGPWAIASALALALLLHQLSSAGERETRRALGRALTHLTQTRAECEASPTSWRAPMEEEAVVLSAAAAARLPGPLGESLRTADVVVVSGIGRAEAAARLPWGSGACAVLVVRRPWAMLDAGLLAVPLVMIVALLLATASTGLLLQRVRRLTRAAEQLAASGFHAQLSLPHDEELGTLARLLEDASAEVRRQTEERVNRERVLREFVGNTTHDVMVPLTVLQGQLSRLSSADPATVPRLLAGAVAEVAYIGALVRNLATAAQLDAQGEVVSLSPTDLSQLCERVVARHAPLADARNVELTTGVPPVPVLVEADATLLEQALGNLVSNAVRYNRAGGHVAVVLDLEGPGFLVRVLDDGPGLTAAERARLRGEGGPAHSGRGLDIVARVVRLHRFELRCHDQAPGLEVQLRGPRKPS